MLQNMPKKGNPALWIILIVVVLIAVAAILYFGDFFNANSNTNTNTVLNTNTGTNINTVANTNTANNQNINSSTNTNGTTNTNSSVDTSDWKTYSNSDYGFAFKYPETWYLKEFTEIDQRTSLVAVFGTNEITSLFDTDSVFTAEVQTLKLTNGFTVADISAEFEVQIASSETIKIDGYDAIKLGNVNYYGLVVLINPTTKQVLHFTPKSSSISDDLNAIYNSLTITK